MVLNRHCKVAGSSGPQPHRDVVERNPLRPDNAKMSAIQFGRPPFSAHFGLCSEQQFGVMMCYL